MEHNEILRQLYSFIILLLILESEKVVLKIRPYYASYSV